MKKSLFSMLLLCAFSSLVVAQSGGYVKVMKTNIYTLDTVRSQQGFAALTNTFERIARKEKSLWEPYYYAALGQINQAFVEKEKENIDLHCNKAEVYLAKADSLSPNNSEVYCLKSMVATARIRVDFMERGMKYISLSNQLLQSAREMDPDNPRVYFLLGQNVKGTPKGYGGGVENAYKLFEKAGSLFAQQLSREETIQPHWGRKPVENFLTKYSQTVKETSSDTK